MFIAECIAGKQFYSSRILAAKNMVPFIKRNLAPSYLSFNESKFNDLLAREAYEKAIDLWNQFSKENLYTTMFEIKISEITEVDNPFTGDI